MGKLHKFFYGLVKPMPLNDFKDYDEYWDMRGFVAPALNRAKLISKYVEHNSRILDIGCGGGEVISYLSKNNSAQKIVGIDFSPKVIKLLTKKGFKGKIIDIQSKKFKPFLRKNKFDYIIMTEVLEHIQNPEQVILEIKETLPKAILFISIPNAGFITHRLRLLFGRFPLTMVNCHIKEHIRFWTLSDFLYWSEHLGYKVTDFELSSKIQIFGIDLGKLSPSLFGRQIIFRLKSKNL